MASSTVAAIRSGGAIEALHATLEESEVIAEEIAVGMTIDGARADGCAAGRTKHTDVHQEST